MNARGLAALAALGGLGVATAAPGWASPAAPAPTVSVATYVQGVQLPANIATASWSKVKPGCAGVMTLSGPSVSGTTTVATGAMTSRWFRPRNGRLLSLTVGQNGSSYWRPFPEGFHLKVRLRAQGHRWSPWFNLAMTLEPSSPPLPDLVVQYSLGLGLVLSEETRKGHPLPLQQVQTRLIDSATSTAVLDDEFALTMGC